MLDILFTLNCEANVIVHFEMDKLANIVSFSVAFNHAALMFVDPAHEVVGHANVDGAAGSAC
jgi:hypothetical protein